MKGYTLDRKTLTPALRQADTAINTTNTWSIVFEWDSSNIKLNIVSKPLRLVSKPLRLVAAIISLLEQHNEVLQIDLSVTLGVSTVFLVGITSP